jgi:hypothetical protein
MKDLLNKKRFSYIVIAFLLSCNSNDHFSYSNCKIQVVIPSLNNTNFINANTYYGTDNDNILLFDTINNVYVDIWPVCNSSTIDIYSGWLDSKSPYEGKIEYTFRVVLDTEVDEENNSIRQTILSYDNYKYLFDENVALTKSLYNECGYAQINIIKKLDKYDLYSDVKWAKKFKNIKIRIIDESEDEVCD